MPNGQTITLLLRELAGGEKQAFDQLIPLVYAELRRIAEARLRSERPGHTFQPTDLVHEVYARMAGGEQLSFVDRAHFLGVAAHTMRKILIDHARVRNAAKRDHGKVKVSLEEAVLIPLQRPSAVIALDDALISLEKEDPLMARLIELRYFGGLTAEESSVVVKLEVPEVRRELRQAQAWLRRELERAP
jgi:RNA polymerase sigma factor (TIGR02999 family)